MNRKSFIASVIAFAATPFHRFRRKEPTFIMGKLSRDKKWVTAILHIREK